MDLEPQLKTFGFEYEFAGSRYAASVVATCQAEAEARMKQMATSATCHGEISQANFEQP